MATKTKKPPRGEGRLANDCVLADAHSITQNAEIFNEKTVILDQERIRDGFRKGQPTAAFLLTLEDDKGAQTIWRGFNRDGALEAAGRWARKGVSFLDKTREAQK